MTESKNVERFGWKPGDLEVVLVEGVREVRTLEKIPEPVNKPQSKN